MPAYFRRTREIYAVLKDYPTFIANPVTPDCHAASAFAGRQESAIQLRNRIAPEHGIWLFNNAVHTALPGYCMFEWYVGDQMLNIDNNTLRQAWILLAAAYSHPLFHCDG
jgi:hypothetical protein